MSKNTQISELINYLSFDGSGNIFFNTVSAATTNTDKFLVSDAGTLKFRTAAQLLSDIGAQASGSYQAALSGTGFVKISGSTISYDNSTYLTTASANSTYLPLTGGTLTGALSGTSATFSGLLEVTNSYVNFTRGGQLLQLNPNYGNANIYAQIDSALPLSLAVGGVDALTISSTGAATFSSLFPVLTVQGTVSAPHIGSLWSVSANQDGVGRTIIGTAGQGRAMYFENNGDIVIPNNSLSGTSATFSGSVTAADQIRITGTTAQALYLYGAATVKPYITINEYGVRDWKIGAGTSVSGMLSITSTLGGTDGITISGGGNVGIGITSPYEKLTIDGGNIILGGASDNYTSTRGIYFRSNYSPNGAYSGVTNATRNISIVANVNKLELNSYEGIDFYTSYTPRISILTNGNVGIGTVTSTVNSLQKYLSITDNYNVGIILNDTRAASAFELYMAGSMFYINYGTSNKFNIDGSTGNVGIGTTSPTEKLEVAGAVRVGRKVLGWYQVTVPDGNSYWHIKTSLWSGGSPSGNTQYTMSLLHAELYSYSNPLIREGRQGWHNWSGIQYNIVNTGNIWSNPYTSSDGYVVLVLNTSGSYLGLNIDWSQVFAYPYVDVYVQAASGSSSTTGVY